MKVLFELFVEELPTTEMGDLEERVVNTLEGVLGASNVEHGSVDVFVTPRRIGVRFECEDFTRSESKKIMGPPEAVAYKDGEPTRALLGFLNRYNASVEDVEIEETKKGRYVSIVSISERLPVRDLLCELMKSFVWGIPFEKRMRWGNGDFLFVRPIHNILMLVNDRLFDCDFGVCKATDFTYTHRFMNPGKVFPSFDSYERILGDRYVIARSSDRVEMIKKQLLSFEDLDVVLDDELLMETANLCEFPYVVKGEFEEEFLRLPAEVLITSMKNHQRYFAFKKDGRLTNKFAAVSNVKLEDMSGIITGYERVLKARFRDAEFFYEEDKRKPLEAYVEGLKNMVFHEGLGSQYDRVKRLEKLCAFIAGRLGVSVEKAVRAAYLSKADLLTQMVYEFPELQGIMGREYAKLSGEDPEVAEALYEQYLPRDDKEIKTGVGLVLSLADKIDLITGGFVMNLKPTGNKDPYGLRRAASGIVRSLINRRVHLGLSEVFKTSADLYGKSVNITEIMDFVKVRFYSYLSDYPYDLISGVVAAGFDDVFDAFLRLKALSEFVNRDKDKSYRFAIKRVFNIVPSGFEDIDVNGDLLVEPEEKALFGIVEGMEDKLSSMERDDYSGVLSLLSSIRDTINTFFDRVLVMDKDEGLRKNRLAMLNRLRRIALRVADFKQLEI